MNLSDAVPLFLDSLPRYDDEPSEAAVNRLGTHVTSLAR